MEIILASQSPRRKELLARLVPEFTVMPADIDETVPAGITPVAYVEKMAAEKAAVVSETHPEALVIASDTIVVHQDKILGKPVSEVDAFQMLQGMSDATHTVYTAVVLQKGAHKEATLSSAEVTFYPLTTAEINAYLATGKYADKAGAYGIQEQASVFVKEIHGDYYSIVGFPIGKVNQMLKQF
ncbi:septum formation protein [Enterococcus sp. PF1-24]|uniref:Maf family protein n=1 Tax=unclassified Enterococcus TaxID=2608891 RepID=UPI00247594A9|nr:MULTISPECIES: Maf family protein [unclassified Enterococcus]MDH6363774.1 septum formation protein [Enterococcus sp. PFB1-1]MDH6400730.1 septum formation protein [Enterococcus sp. PF1-24]